MAVIQSPQKAEAGKLGVQGQPWLHSELKFSLGYMWPCTKRKREIIFQSLTMSKWSTPEKFRDISSHKNQERLRKIFPKLSRDISVSLAIKMT